MKLTGWFSQDKIADNSRVQTPNNANTEQVNRQIRAPVSYTHLTLPTN